MSFFAQYCISLMDKYKIDTPYGFYAFVTHDDFFSGNTS